MQLFFLIGVISDSQSEDAFIKRLAAVAANLFIFYSRRFLLYQHHLPAGCESARSQMVNIHTR